MRNRAILCALLGAIAGCDDFSSLSPPPPHTGGPGSGSCTTQVSLSSGGAVDILFMVDNSSSMDAMSAELRARFATFLQPFEALAAKGISADLHIGVVTSDYGAGKVRAVGCDPTPGGQKGMLQAIGQAAPKNCLAPIGHNFISYDFASPAHANLPGGQDLATTFACMAAVGSNGCGYEMPLESVYAALPNFEWAQPLPIPESTSRRLLLSL